MRRLLGPLICVFVGIVVIPALGFIVFEMTHKAELERPPFPMVRLRSLAPGSKTNDVRQLLGSPSHVGLGTNAGAQVDTLWV